MEIIGWVCFGLLGLVVGSFLNLCIDRLPRDESIAYPPSHCPACQHRLQVLDLVPLLSYISLRGRCRYCHTGLSPRMPIVEGANGLFFALLFGHFGLSPELGIMLVYLSLFTVIFVIDLEHQLVLDKVVYPGMVLALAFSFPWPGLGPIAALLGAATGAILMLLPFLIFRGGMGFGDVKLAGLIGLACGFPQVLIALFAAIVSGGLVAAFLLLVGLKRRGDPIPFAPFLAAAAVFTLIWGDMIQYWYQAILF